jgi:serine/threonine-protein kinase
MNEPDSDAPPTELSSSADSVTSASRFDQLRYFRGGGLGDVFQAVDTGLNREVALKFIKQSHAGNPDLRARFRVEAEITGRLDHPNVVPVFGVGESWDGRPFYAMRFIRGKRLSDKIIELHSHQGTAEEWRLELRRLLEHFIVVCNTVAYAHSRGVVHRDIKPDNVMIGRYQETVVLDWGLAVVVERDEMYRDSDEPTLAVAQSSSGDTSVAGIGTKGYMPPEQLRAPQHVKASSDIYALGATLYHLLTGQRAFRQGASDQEIQQNQFTPPRAHNKRIAPPLEAVCLKAMATEPEQRYATAQALAADVQAWLDDEPLSAYAETPLERLIRWLRCHRTASLALGAAVLMVTTVSLIAAGLLRREAARELAARSLAETERAEATTAREGGMQVAAAFAARTVAYEIDLRFHILETAAVDPQLQQLVESANQQEAIDGATRLALDQWVLEHAERAKESTKSTSWFITDRRGRQIARYPRSDKSFGESFARRDYFHGMGRELTPDEAAQAKPIDEAHLSTVFTSTNTRRPTVAFSVPIWQRAEGAGEPIGVLAMTVQAGEFSVLSAGLHADQMAALIDLRPDQVDEHLSAGGIFLFHPDLAAAKQQRIGRNESPYIRLDRAQLEQLRALTEKRLALDSVASTFVALPESLRHDYIDPVGGRHAPITAAFEPVMLRGRADEIKRTGWVVVVQERE